MRRIALAAIAALLLAGSCATTAFAKGSWHSTPLPARCSIQSFRPFSAHVWDIGNWRRGAPKPATFAAERRRLACAPPAHRAAMSRTWARDRAAYNHKRRSELWRERWTPYYGCTTLGGCKWWAIPAYIVDCESGGDYTPSIGALTFGGAYGLLIATYHEFGGRFATAREGPPKEQDRIARELFEREGHFGPWACA
jgi:hypothetical protein